MTSRKNNHREKLIELRIRDRIRCIEDGALGTVWKKRKGVAWINWDDGLINPLSRIGVCDFIRGPVNPTLELVWPPAPKLARRS